MTQQEKAVTSLLTDQELDIANRALVDIGAGYPQISFPNWMRELLFDTSHLELAYAFPPAVSPSRVGDLTEALLRSACQRLGISETNHSNGFVTFSGSIALDRALESQLSEGTSVVTSSPCIDIIPGMISERGGVAGIYVPCKEGSFDVDVDALLEAVREDTSCIILTSPENPTGNVITEGELTRLAAGAAEHGVTLILDHCFALLDPFACGIPLLPNVAPPELKWICVWDTGKTFGMNEEKLGFIFCSPLLREQLRERLNILQFDVSRRQKLLFRRIFDASRTHDYQEYLSNIVADNIRIVEEACRDLPLEPLVPDAGSLLLVDVSRTGRTGSDMSDLLLASEGLGVIKGRNFFQPLASARLQPGHDDYIRFAMARDPQVVLAAMARLARACGYA